MNEIFENLYEMTAFSNIIAERAFLTGNWEKGLILR